VDFLAPSSSGPGRRPLKAVAPVRIRSGLHSTPPEFRAAQLQIERHRRGLVPEHRLHDLDVRAGRDGPARCRVAQLVRLQALDTDRRRLDECGSLARRAYAGCPMDVSDVEE
jgi:hypothetical protein